ncbi:MAG: DUF1566 domain-containing protein [Methylococcaceae bacterium]|nr:DUF1566 domain-containing protein [Methylococcaceae bacterium]
MRTIASVIIAVLLVLLLRRDMPINSGVVIGSAHQVWQRCEAGLSYNGITCKGMALTVSWQQALSYCAALEDGTRTWHLPSREALMSYYHETGRSGLHFVNLYWMSTTDSQRPELAWYLIPGLDWVYTNFKELDGLVLCVSDTL